MKRTRENATPISVTLGYAAGPEGDGVAYAALGAGSGRPESLVRVSFRCRPQAALLGRDVAYAALGAVAAELLERGIAAAVFRIAEASVPRDLDERRAVPSPLIVPYVTLRCALNRFASATVSHAVDRTIRDLTARARADASLTVAA
jgi:hypothetical protein